MHEENWCEVIFKWVIWHTFESWQSVLWRRWENPTGTSHLPISIICKSSEKLLTLFPHELKNSWFNQSCEEIFKDFFKWKSACIHFVQNCMATFQYFRACNWIRMLIVCTVTAILHYAAIILILLSAEAV